MAEMIEQVNVFETGSGKWIAFATLSGFSSSENDATNFKNEETAKTMMSMDLRYAWLLEREVLEYRNIKIPMMPF